MQHERRNHLGIAVVTNRPRQISHYCQSAGLSARMLSVQSGPAWPDHRPPVLLDTIGLPVNELVALLARPPRLSAPPAARPAAEPRFAPVMAVADPSDWRALRLLRLCPAIELVCSENPAGLVRWLAYLEHRVLAHPRADQTVWLVEPPPDRSVDQALLPILAALLLSPSYSEVAARCNLSESTLYRSLRAIRHELGLPPSSAARLEPGLLYERIIERLTEPRPLPR